MAELDRVLPFEVQLKVWKADWSGDLASREARTAAICENQDYADGDPFWDHGVRWLFTHEVRRDGELVPTPTHWALPHVAALEFQRVTGVPWRLR